MNIDAILSKLNERQVNYLLIGGVNFLLRHQPISTVDVDVWIEDSEEIALDANKPCRNWEQNRGQPIRIGGQSQRYLPDGWSGKECFACRLPLRR